MKFTVSQHHNTSVSLMTDMGYVLGYFNSVDEALTICDQWYTSNSNEHKYDVRIIPTSEYSPVNKLLAYFRV